MRTKKSPLHAEKAAGRKKARKLGAAAHGNLHTQPKRPRRRMAVEECAALPAGGGHLAAAAASPATARQRRERGMLDFSADGVNKSHLVRLGHVAHPTKYYFISDDFSLVTPPRLTDVAAQLLHHIISALLSRERFERPVRFAEGVVVYPAREVLQTAQVGTFQRALAEVGGGGGGGGELTVVSPVQLTVAIHVVDPALLLLN